MKVAIIYSSITGNTKLLAETIKNTIKDNKIVYFGKVTKDIPDADLYFVGSWTNKGNASDEIINFLKTLKNKKIAIFGTAGYGKNKSYYETLFNRVKKELDETNKVLGYFYSQGKMPLSVRERYVKMITQNKEDVNLKVSIDNFDEALSHPDKKDLEDTSKWVLSIINN